MRQQTCPTTMVAVAPTSHRRLETSDAKMTTAQKTRNPKRVAFGNEPTIEVDRNIYSTNTVLHFVPGYFYDLALIISQSPGRMTK